MNGWEEKDLKCVRAKSLGGYKIDIEKILIFAPPYTELLKGVGAWWASIEEKERSL